MLPPDNGNGGPSDLRSSMFEEQLRAALVAAAPTLAPDLHGDMSSLATVLTQEMRDAFEVEGEWDA